MKFTDATVSTIQILSIAVTTAIALIALTTEMKRERIQGQWKLSWWRRLSRWGQFSFVLACLAGAFAGGLELMKVKQGEEAKREQETLTARLLHELERTRTAFKSATLTASYEIPIERVPKEILSHTKSMIHMSYDKKYDKPQYIGIGELSLSVFFKITERNLNDYSYIAIDRMDAEPNRGQESDLLMSVKWGQARTVYLTHWKDKKILEFQIPNVPCELQHKAVSVASLSDLHNGSCKTRFPFSPFLKTVDITTDTGMIATITFGDPQIDEATTYQFEGGGQMTEFNSNRSTGVVKVRN